jgi:hypothetical protein
MRTTRAALVFALAFVLASASASALESPDILRANFGVLLESRFNPGFKSHVPTPSLNFDIGAGLNYPFSPGSSFSFAPSALLYFYNAEFMSGQPVATDQAFSPMYVFGAFLNAPVMYTMPLGNSDFTLAAGLGLCFDLRFAIKSSDIEADAGDNNREGTSDAIKDANKYFWGKGRFVSPSTTLCVEYALNDRIGVGLLGRMLWPIYNAWTKEDFGFFDQTKYLINITLRYKLKSKAAATVETAAAAAVPADPASAAAPAQSAGTAPSPAK